MSDALPSSFHAFLTGLDDYAGQVASYHFFPPRKPRVDGVYAGPYAGMLAQLAIAPYTHQVAALQAVAAGEDVVMATPTASGKSLVFQLPVLAAALRGRTSIMLYPTKALARDQEGRLRALAGRLSTGRQSGVDDLADAVASYDGDTPPEDRTRLRESAACLLTNPDMLHYGILPHHADWSHTLARLELVVLDELHAYRGVLGTHVANVVRRLLRLAKAHGAQPAVIAASATIGNPAEHAERLTGRPARVIDFDEAPSGPREFVMWRPPELPETGRRRSTNGEAALVAAALARAGIKTLVFCNSRKSAELIRRYAADLVGGELAAAIQSYRAGYTAEDRRLIEAGFRNGDIRVLAATSALELGMDIGGVDAVVLAGYPGSKMALWQRSGRAGRGGERSLTLLIPGADPLDEYYLHDPDALVDGPIESAIADPFNTELHPLHVACAAAESPLDEQEPWLAPWLDLRSVPGLSPRAGKWVHAGRYPHRRLSIRGTGGKLIRLKDGMGRSLGTADLATALRELHPGAVYLHQGESLLVADLDLDKGIARLLPHISDYYTQPRSETDVEVLAVGQGARRAAGPVSEQVPDLHGVLSAPQPGVAVGRVVVRHAVTGYVLKRQFSEAVLDERHLDLPELSYPTEALWFSVDGVPGIPRPDVLPAALHALEHTLIQLLPAFVLCERADVGGVSYPHYPPTGGSCVFVYDGYPGGVGYVRAGAAVFRDWLGAAHELLTKCRCKDGCPRCVLSPKCGNGNQFLDKRAAAQVAAALLAEAERRAPVPVAS